MAAPANTVFRGLEGSIKKVPVELPAELKPKEVLIKITHASLCGTDVHMIQYGCALGHEGVGVVEKIGSDVTQFKVGDRAGAGYLRNVSLVFLLCVERIRRIWIPYESTNKLGVIRAADTAITVSRDKISIAMSAMSTERRNSTLELLEIIVRSPLLPCPYLFSVSKFPKAATPTAYDLFTDTTYRHRNRNLPPQSPRQHVI